MYENLNINKPNEKQKRNNIYGLLHHVKNKGNNVN